MIGVEDVSVAFGRTIALDGVSLEFSSGVNGLFGPNAAGKSTLLRAISGLLHPTSGRVTLDGREVTSADESFRRKIGYAGHESGLYPRLSLRENLAFFAAMYGVPGNVTATIAGVGLAEWADEPVGALSAGYKHRAAVARSLVHDPDVLLLDEPYANLDDDASEVISSAIRSWWKPGRAAVIATHGAKRLKAFADTSTVLQRGRVVSFRTRSTAVTT